MKPALRVDRSHGEGGGQILVPLAMADGTSRYSVEEVSLHPETNACLIERFGTVQVAVVQRQDGTGIVAVIPADGPKQNLVDLQERITLQVLARPQ